MAILLVIILIVRSVRWIPRKKKRRHKQRKRRGREIEDYVPPKQIVVVDPTYEETKLCNALIHVIVDENGNGLEQSHDGASEVDETVLAKAIAAAKLRHGEVWKRIEQFDEMKEEEDEDEEVNYLLLFISIILHGRYPRLRAHFT